MEAAPLFRSTLPLADLSEFYRAVRERTRALAQPLSDADATVQSMPDASPTKWHLAHTTWFFEAMVLKPYLQGYHVFNEDFAFLFNSYYEALGQRQPRPKRGLITRPTLEAIYDYREHVDAAIAALLRADPPESVADLVELGCQHEQQHQELLLTDVLHLFAQNPLHPAYQAPHLAAVSANPPAPTFVGFDGGTVEIGHGGDGFAFDCESPRHRVIVPPFRLADRAVTNQEWITFVADGGYRDPLLWLSAGWAKLSNEGWELPLYWEKRGDTYWTMTLEGARSVDLFAPVAHVSYFEADAFARWSKRRLPTEAEWECAASTIPVSGNFADDGRLRPAPALASLGGLRQMFGDVWEWTESAFSPYPGFHAAPGAVGEYNGKFMCGQFVLRGGSCATPAGHVRATYRNFFPPDARWQFSGVRLAEDA